MVNDCSSIICIRRYTAERSTRIINCAMLTQQLSPIFNRQSVLIRRRRHSRRSSSRISRYMCAVELIVWKLFSHFSHASSVYCDFGSSAQRNCARISIHVLINCKRCLTTLSWHYNALAFLQIGHQWETYKEECDEVDREIEQLKKKHHQEREKLAEESNRLRVRFSTAANSLLMQTVFRKLCKENAKSNRIWPQSTLERSMMRQRSSWRARRKSAHTSTISTVDLLAGWMTSLQPRSKS